jgi:hypothetical protein
MPDLVDLNIVLIYSHGERYIIAAERGRHQEAMCQIGRWAANPELCFDWNDAREAARHLRRLVEEDCCGS